MDPTQFSDMLARRMRLMADSLDAKGKEYAPGADRLHNFKRASGLKGRPAAEMAWDFAIKHIVSITDMVEHPADFTLAQWDEKIGDLINYGFLVECCAMDARMSAKRKR